MNLRFQSYSEIQLHNCYVEKDSFTQFDPGVLRLECHPVGKPFYKC